MLRLRWILVSVNDRNRARTKARERNSGKFNARVKDTTGARVKARAMISASPPPSFLTSGQAFDPLWIERAFGLDHVEKSSRGLLVVSNPHPVVQPSVRPE